MPWIFTMIPAFASLQKLLTGLLAAPATQHLADLMAIDDIVRTLASQGITLDTLGQLAGLRDDVAASVWEHDEAQGTISPSDAMNRSESTTKRNLHQAPPAGDVLREALLQVYFAIDRALGACTDAMHLPRRLLPRNARLDRAQPKATRRRRRA